nr:hypothetical protein [Micromonospora sp. DSM 115978]
AQVLDRTDYVGGRNLQPQATAYNAILDGSVAGWSTPRSRVVVARTYDGWDPYAHTWDGSHPNPTGEVYIARGVANALWQLGVGAQYGPIYGRIEWPAVGRAVTAASQPNRIALSWGTTPGATSYLIEQRVVSYGEQTFTRLPYGVSATSWTTGALPPGFTAEYRVVPVKGVMIGLPGPAVRAVSAVAGS